MVDKIAVIINSLAGGSLALRKRHKIESLLDYYGLNYDLHVCTQGKNLVSITDKVVQNNEVILGAGGDTTLSLIASKIMQGGRDNIFGILPVGSTNDLAKGLRLMDMNSTLQAIKNHETQHLDLGQISGIDDSKELKSKYFLSSASVGLGVETNLYVEEWMERHHRYTRFRSQTKYVPALIALIQAFRKKKVPVNFNLRANGRDIHLNSPLVAFQNTPFYGGEFVLSPRANHLSGKLDCCIFDPHITNLTKLSVSAIAIKLNKHIQKNYVSVIRSSSFTIDSDQPLSFLLDGDVQTFYCPIQLSIKPKAIRIFKPKD